MERSENIKYRIRKLKKAYSIESVAALEILENIAKTWEIMENAEKELNNHGSTITKDRFEQEKPHPAVGIIKDCTQQIISQFKALGIDLNHSQLEEDEDPISMI